MSASAGVGGGQKRESALLIHTLHEMTDPAMMIRQIRSALRPGGRLLLMEKRGHVSEERRAALLALLPPLGFTEVAARTDGSILYERGR